MKIDIETKKMPISRVNTASKEQPDTLIERSESYYKKCVEIACDSAVEKSKNIILLTGPSSAGKTTTSNLLCAEFEARGKKAMRISLDDFYKNRDELPFWEDGSRNYESIEGLDLDCFNRCINELMEKGVADFPVFDFPTGRVSDKTYEVHYDNNTFLIFEGIHALNPVFSKMLHVRKCARIYVSVLSEFIDDDENVIMSSRNLRLIRRILRDNSDRATPADLTLDLWDKVCLGEDKYIRPYRGNADLHIDSTLYYEPMVYKKAITRLLKDFKGDKVHKDKFDELLTAVAPFETLPIKMVPKNSLLREFISENQSSDKSSERPREL